MHFCSACANMYYIRIQGDEGDQLEYYCRKCGHIDTSFSKQNVCVSKIELKKSEETNYNINEFTKYDHTLPRKDTDTICCPNAECVSNTEADTKKEIVYIRYDDVRMKYVYLCCHCDTIWEIKDVK